MSYAIAFYDDTSLVRKTQLMTTLENVRNKNEAWRGTAIYDLGNTRELGGNHIPILFVLLHNNNFDGDDKSFLENIKCSSNNHPIVIRYTGGDDGYSGKNNWIQRGISQDGSVSINESEMLELLNWAVQKQQGENPVLPKILSPVTAEATIAVSILCQGHLHSPKKYKNILTSETFAYVFGEPWDSQLKTAINEEWPEFMMHPKVKPLLDAVDQKPEITDEIVRMADDAINTHLKDVLS